MKESVDSLNPNEKMKVMVDYEKPIPPFNLVALVWALSSKAEDIDYEKFVENYLSNIVNNKKFGSDFSKNILPSFYAVAAKISIQRKRTRERLEKLEELQEIKLKNLEKIYDLGTSVKGILSRLIGIIGGAGAVAGVSISLNAYNPGFILLGIVIGYLIIEFILWRYKSNESEKIHCDIERIKKRIWDEEFTIETHLATMRLYNEAIEFNKKYDSKRYKIRDKARDLQKIAQMFLERPNLSEGSLYKLIKFLDISIQIEDKLRKYIEKYHQNDFKVFAKKQDEDFQDETDDDKIHNNNKYNPKKRGLKILSNFLYQQKYIGCNNFKNINKIREARREIIKYANYDRLTDILEVAENTLQTIGDELQPKLKTL